ncbi:outer membrane protein assembly factor BamA [Parabacteroides sp. PFB2-10]|uniref:translocation and assembly module lipoprotein TamL n=1 Tax=Parabacteroides sp. PFB2-10 TaxID=1742405 RepID=UPI002476075D|nr:BamA/TamA family outer membrane protein [Parabacteroides sp. PFB2-10]MDH6313576.1 outer membrane protein assembly factor BamA [Parabacteroides sp. PFB2-10]
MKGLVRLLCCLIFAAVLASCSSTKFVSEGEYLLDKVQIDSDNPDYKPTDLKPYLRQQPNFKLFGLVRWQLYVYNWSGRNDKNWVNKQLRRIGEKPVLLDTTLVEQSADELSRFLYNKGYINAEVNASVDTSRHKKATVTYHITSNDPYRIRQYNMELDDPRVDSIAHLQPQHRSRLSAAFRSAPEGLTPLVKEGALFDRDLLDQERQRLTTLFRRHGYYAFNRDHLAYWADSSFQQNVVDMGMVLRPFRRYQPDGTYVDTLHRPFYIQDVTILTDYNALDLDADSRFTQTDSVTNGNIHIRYGISGKSIRPGVLRNATYLVPGQIYNERQVEQTYSAFSSLHALKNTNIRFEEFEENDTLKLHATILTSPAKPQSFGVDLEGTHNAGDLGFASSLSYQHRNLFKGAEVFTARIRGAYESLSGNRGSGLDSYWEYGGEASIRFPSFLFPFISHDFKRKLRASTELRVSYNNQRRPEYERAIVSGGWNYIWQDRSNALARHTFKLLDVDYVFLSRVQSSFIDSLPASMVLYNYSDQFIVSSGYTYSFNSYTPQNRMRNTHSLRISFEAAGNILYGLSSLLNADKDKNGRYKLLGINYSQFVKGDVDFSKGIILDNRNRLAFHVGVGAAIPYGNAEMMPFERRYFSGGANSVRGWSVRTLGPGSMPRTSATNFALQVGDIRLDLNLEYRTKLFWKFELASYIDAGNIWTIRKYEDQPNGNFEFKRFYKEIAVSYGLGLRLDFDFFLVRLDTGMKAYNPQERGDRQWPLLHPKLSKDFAWHFAVGYPF